MKLNRLTNPLLSIIKLKCNGAFDVRYAFRMKQITTNINVQSILYHCKQLVEMWAPFNVMDTFQKSSRRVPYALSITTFSLVTFSFPKGKENLTTNGVLPFITAR